MRVVACCRLGAVLLPLVLVLVLLIQLSWMGVAFGYLAKAAGHAA
jgi:hypothetical protein